MRRAQALLKADAGGPSWSDAEIAADGFNETRMPIAATKDHARRVD